MSFTDIDNRSGVRRKVIGVGFTTVFAVCAENKRLQPSCMPTASNHMPI